VKQLLLLRLDSSKKSEQRMMSQPHIVLLACQAKLIA
jgi:hypothetical protein